MPLASEKTQELRDILCAALRKKMSDYNPETRAMPLHTRLLGGDRMALFSFIQSLNTSFGVSIYEPVAKSLASDRFAVECQAIAGDCIFAVAQENIQRIMDDLIAERASASHNAELGTLREVCRRGEMREIKPTRVDIKLTDAEGEIYLIDIKTAKPNRDGAKQYKRTLLEWMAVTLAQNPNVDVQAFIGIPYNPYDPKPYARWTMASMLENGTQLKVAEELWNFLAGTDCYDQLLQIFAQVGEELQDELNAYFARHVK